MKIYQIVLFMALIFLSSCSTDSPHDSWLRNADKAEVYRMVENVPVSAAVITEVEKLEKLRYFFGFSDAEAFLCAHSGMIRAFQGDKKLDLYVQTSASCQHVFYTFEGKDYYKTLTHDGKKVLEMLFIQ